METLIGAVVGLLRMVPLILAFYLPALAGLAIYKERSKAYKLKAGLWFIVGFATIVAIRLVIGSTSTLQVAAMLGLSLVQIALALALAYLTVYKLAD